MTKLSAIRRVAVLGAGSMGLQLAAHLSNACLEVILFDLADSGPDPISGLRRKLAALIDSHPPALALPRLVHTIQAATFQHNLTQLSQCDLIIETTSELCDCKEGVLARIAPYVSKHAIIVSNTDTVSIERLARALPEALRLRFCGLHFLMPPRYTRLVELAPAATTDERVLQHLEHFTLSVLGKQVVRVKDSPLYIADRYAVFVTARALRHSQSFGLSLEIIDSLLARTFGMSADAVFGTIDRLGVSRFMRLAEYAWTTLQDDAYLQQDQWPEALLGLERGTQSIFYRQQNAQRMSLDIASGQYPPLSAEPLPPESDWLTFVGESSTPEAQFLRQFLADLCWYAATHLEQMAPSCAEFDLALRFAFGLKLGVFELWQKLGWERVQQWRSEAEPWPTWVQNNSAAYQRKGAYAPAEQRFKPFRFASVYARQIRLPALLGEAPVQEASCPHPGLDLWRAEEQIVVLTVQESAVLYDIAALDALRDCLNELFTQSKGLVLELRCRTYDPCANLPCEPELWLDKLSDLYLQIRYAPIPIISTLNEQASKPILALAAACTQRFIALNTCLHTGSAGIPLPIIVGMGHALLTQLAKAPNALAGQVLAACYAGALMSMRIGAAEACQYGLLPATDTILLNPAELSGRAVKQLQLWQDNAYQPSPAWPVAVLGQDSQSTVYSLLRDQFPEQQLDPHIKNWQAPLLELLCGGQHNPGELLSDDAILALERDCCLRLWPV